MSVSLTSSLQILAGQHSGVMVHFSKFLNMANTFLITGRCELENVNSLYLYQASFTFLCWCLFVNNNISGGLGSWAL